MKDKHLVIKNTTLVKCYDQFETVVVPEGVEEIDSYAFGQCENLKEVILPSTLNNIDTAAFYGCKKLEKINLPSSLKEIDDFAFASCEKLKEITIPKGIKTINPSTFSGCESLTNVYLPASIKTIGAHAFYGCLDLKTINLENVEHLENHAFTYTHLDSIVFDKIKSIDIFSIDASKLNYIWFRCIPENIDENFLSADPDITKIKISKENYTKLPKFLTKQFSDRILITDNSLEDLIEEKKTLKEVNTYLSHIEER